MEDQNATSFSSSQQLSLNPESISYLEETRKWAYFLSIIGFITVGLVLLIGLLFSSVMSSFSEQLPSAFPMKFLSIIYVVIAVFYFFPILYLYRFSVQMKTALREMNQPLLTSSFANLKSLFRFMGIITIIILSLYLIMFITALIVGVGRSF